MAEQTQSRETVSWQQPSHPELILVKQGKEGTFGTRAESLVSLPAGAVFCDLSAARPASKRTYATVQASETTDIDLNSDVVFFNHSCNPSMIIDPANNQVRVGKKPINKGDELTLFYPSFEWNMSQPFTCICNEDGCLGLIEGARNIDKSSLQKYWLTEHVAQLAGLSQANDSATNGSVTNGANGINGSHAH